MGKPPEIEPPGSIARSTGVKRSGFAATLCRCLMVALCGAWCACVNPVDELYDAPEPPRLPALPDAERVDACRACARDKCDAERTACLADEGCRKLLECKGVCADPTCLQACTAQYGYSPWYGDLWGCVMIDQCAEPCLSGENFACVDAYGAPKAEKNEERFPLRLHIKNPRTRLASAFSGDERDEQFVVGAAARSCAPANSASSQCQPIDSGTVDLSDTVELALIAQQVTRYFTGTVEVELPDSSQADPALFRQLGWRDRYMLPPLAQAQEFRLYVYWRGLIREAVMESGATIDFESAAPLAIYFEDCMGAPARGVRLELTDQSKIEVLNQVADGTSSTEATDFGAALVGDIPDPVRRQAIGVQAVQVKTGRVLAKRSDVYVRAGWTTHVWLSPRPAL